MALRGFGVQTLTTGTAVPAFGTKLTAAITVITTDRYAGTTDPRANQSVASAVVTNTNFFRIGDHVLVGPAAGPWDGGYVTSITPGSAPAGTLGIRGLVKAHVSTDYVILAISCAGLYINTNVVGSILYIGEDSTVASTSATVIASISTAQSAAGKIFSPSTAPTINALDTQHLWIIGSTNDTFTPSILLI